MGSARVVVLAPAPQLTVTIEERGGADDIHVHAGGQGFWIARMADTLGTDVLLCATFGGETGIVARTLVEHEGIAVRAVEVTTPNPSYVDDRRGGARGRVAEMGTFTLSRHEADELYGAALTSGLAAGAVVLGGPDPGEVLPAEFYGRLAADLHANGVVVVADLDGEHLDAVAPAADLVKVSDEQLVTSGRAASDTQDDLVDAAHALCAAGAGTAVVTRAGRGGLAVTRHDGAEVTLEIIGPDLQPLDVHGAGDSFTAGVTAGLASGADLVDALKLGAAAGALNVTRRGLGTGRRDEIVSLAQRIEVRSP